MLFEGWELDCDQAVFDGRTPDLILIYILMEEFGKTGAARSAVKNDFPGVSYGVLRRAILKLGAKSARWSIS